MATTKISTGVLKDGSVTSAKLDTNISIVGDLTVDTNTLFVDSASNNVGIGTSSPAAKLDVEGLMLNGSTNPSIMDGGNLRKKLEWNGALNSFGVYNTTNAGVDWQTNLLVDSTGNVGIGTTSPNNNGGFTTLTINGATNGGVLSFSQADVRRGLIYTDSSTGDLITQSESLRNLRFNTSGGNERMRIDSSGRVGIGTTSPNAPLSFGSTIGQKITLYDSATGDFALGVQANEFRIASGAGSAITFRNGGYSGTERMRIDSAGNVGIAVIPSSWNGVYRSLQIGNSASISGRIDTNLLELGNNSYRSNSGSWKYINSNTAARQDISSGQFRWYIAPSGIQGNDISWSERMRLETNGDLHVDGDVIAYSTTISDQRLKDDVQTIDNALDKVSNLRGVSYTWNNGKRKGQKDLGLIAQEVEQVLPELVREKEMPMIDGETYKTVDYEKIVGVLIEAVKELKAEVESLKSK